MAEDIRISVDTARFRRRAVSPRASLSAVLKETIVPFAILGAAMMMFIIV